MARGRTSRTNEGRTLVALTMQHLCISTPWFGNSPRRRHAAALRRDRLRRAFAAPPSPRGSGSLEQISNNETRLVLGSLEVGNNNPVVRALPPSALYATASSGAR